jgi:hypothetical protein
MSRAPGYNGSWSCFPCHSPSPPQPSSPSGGRPLSKRARLLLTNLNNQRPTWLDLAHKKLDAAVCGAYGWPADLTDEEVHERWLALNLTRAGVNPGSYPIGCQGLIGQDRADRKRCVSDVL